MSRTYKDRKEVKAKRKKFFQPIWIKRFENNHYKGSDDENDNLELDRCPECNTLTEFQGGFIVCTNCHWGDYYPANGLREEEDYIEIQSAS